MKTFPPGIFSSLRTDWATPSQLYEYLDTEFGFEMDVCANSLNAQSSNFLFENALESAWRGICWMNPPYGRGIGKWIQKAFESSRNGAVVVCLLPARTDTSWWHDYCLKGEIRFLRGRLCFDDEKKKRAPFPSAIVIFRKTAR